MNRNPRIGWLLLVVATTALIAAASAQGKSGKPPKPPKPSMTNLVVPGLKVGLVGIGDSRKEIFQKIGKPVTDNSHHLRKFCDTYLKYSIAVCYRRQHGPPKLWWSKKAGKLTPNGTVNFISVANPSYVTIDGLGIGTNYATLFTAYPLMTEMSWGNDAYGNPPQYRALELEAPDPAHLTRFLVEQDSISDPAVVKTFIIGLKSYMGTLYDYLDSQNPHP